MNFNPQDLLKLKEKTLSSNKMSSIQKMTSTYSMTFRSDKGSKLTIEEMDSNFHYLLENGGGGTITGTPSGILYFDDNGDVTVDDTLLHDSLSTLITHTNYSLNYPEFIGSGLNDINLYINGQFTGPTSSIYTITITGGLAPQNMMNPMGQIQNDTCEWSCNTGATGSFTIDGNLQELDNSLNVIFDSTSGHTIGDQWIISFQTTTSFSAVGETFGGNITGNIAISDDNTAAVNFLGGVNLNNIFMGLLDLSNTNNQTNIKFESIDGEIFFLKLRSQNGATYSAIKVAPGSITFESQTGAYMMPSDNSTGFLKSKGDGTTSWVNGISATYSTADGKIVTVTDGIITSIS